jgi:hypothetical protein
MVRLPLRLRQPIPLLALLASLVLAPAAAAADRKTDTSTFAPASFSGVTSDPCIRAEVDLDAYRFAEIPGSGTLTTQVVLFIDLFDTCESVPLASLSGRGGGQFELRHAKNGKSARLSGTVAACDAACQLIRIDLSYRCIAPRERTRSRFRAPDGSFRFTTRSVTCDAQATGSVRDLDSNIELAPAPSVSATIGSSVTRSVQRD